MFALYHNKGNKPEIFFIWRAFAEKGACDSACVNPALGVTRGSGLTENKMSIANFDQLCT